MSDANIDYPSTTHTHKDALCYEVGVIISLSKCQGLSLHCQELYTVGGRSQTLVEVVCSLYRRREESKREGVKKRRGGRRGGVEERRGGRRGGEGEGEGKEALGTPVE